MGLTQAFAAAWTLRKLRRGPLGHLMDGFCDWLLSLGFSRGCVRTHLGFVQHLNEHLGEEDDSDLDRIGTGDLESFWDAYPRRCRNRGPREGHLRRVSHSIHRFTEYLRLKGRFQEPGGRAERRTLLEVYLEWMRDCRHASAGTLELRRRGVGEFLAGLGPKGTAEGLSELDAGQVEAFFLGYAKTRGRAARRSMQSALRTFFLFCLREGHITRRLDLAVPAFRAYRLSRLPRGLNRRQARRVLESVDRATPAGRRDYAILQMLHSYGVRGGQVRALRLGDIDWARDRILFRAMKNGKDSLLPLTAEVGESLLEYLQDGRPRHDHPEVFLTCRAPYRPLANSNSLSGIVDRRLRAAGVDPPSRGAHAFRHGFATRMVAEGHSLKAVADVLGHRHLSTTFLYAKVDFHALKDVALDWPGEVGP